VGRRFLGRIGCFTADSEAVTVEILDIHFPHAPREVGRCLSNGGAATPIVLIERVDASRALDVRLGLPSV